MFKKKNVLPYILPLVSVPKYCISNFKMFEELRALKLVMLSLQ